MVLLALPGIHLCDIEVELVRYLRGEIHFDSAESLINQMKLDRSEVTGNV